MSAFFGGSAACCFLGWIAYLVIGVIRWLKFGEWRPLGIAELYINQGYPSEQIYMQTAWAGIDRIYNGFLDTGLGLILFLLCFVSAGLAIMTLPKDEPWKVDTVDTYDDPDTGKMLREKSDKLAEQYDRDDIPHY